MTMETPICEPRVEAVHHVGLGTLASALPGRGAALRQGAPRGHRAGWKRRHGVAGPDPTSYAPYVTSATF